MRAALICNRVSGELEKDLAHMEELARRAARQGAELMLFPEAAATGLRNNDDPAHDLPLGTAIPGPITARLAGLARETNAYVASGILEREGNCLYDSAVLVRPDGELALRYRRISPKWHGRKADGAVYREGGDISFASTPYGRLVILICGDLFDDEVIERTRRLRPDYLLVPFARSFDDGSFDQRRWDEEESKYVARAAKAGSTTLMVNLLEDRGISEWPCFGGALAASMDGKILFRLPLGQSGVLLAEV